MPVEELHINQAQPLIMHIDLNSCFATIEQQAKSHWRGDPVGVVAYDSPGGIILAASYEAKRLGIKLGTRIWEAEKIAPNIHICTVDPPKYREAHKRFRSVLEEFTSPDNITPKSIDEFVIDFTGSLSYYKGQSLQDIGRQIKQRVHEVLGEAVFCNVGIGQNRFLAKLASGLNKPDGLDEINQENMFEVYSKLELMALPGINRRYNTRLQLAGILNVTDFLHTDRQKLRAIFGGIVGHYWWLRLRGWEIDDKPTKLGQIGHQFAMKEKLTHEQLDPILYKLSQKIARRLHGKDLSAGGIHVGLRFVRSPYWHKSQKLSVRMVTAQEVFRAARQLLDEHAPHGGLVSLVHVTTFGFEPVHPEQLALITNGRAISDRLLVADTMNKVNDRYGEFALVPATMLGTEGVAKDSIAFGNLN